MGYLEQKQLNKQKQYCTRMPANNVLNANASKPSNLKYTDNDNEEKLIHRAFKVKQKKHDIRARKTYIDIPELAENEILLRFQSKGYPGVWKFVVAPRFLSMYDRILLASLETEIWKLDHSLIKENLQALSDLQISRLSITNLKIIMDSSTLTESQVALCKEIYNMIYITDTITIGYSIWGHAWNDINLAQLYSSFPTSIKSVRLEVNLEIWEEMWEEFWKDEAKTICRNTNTIEKVFIVAEGKPNKILANIERREALSTK